MSTVPCVSGDLTIDKNLIKTAIKPVKMNVNVNELASPKVKEEKPACVEVEETVTQEETHENQEIDTQQETVEIQEIESQADTVELEQVVEIDTTIIKPIKKTFDNNEVVSGFEESKEQIKDLYDSIFGYGDRFKPTYQDTLGDLLSYLGGIAYKFGSESDYTKTFGVSVSGLNDKYYSQSYIPYSIKIAVWAYKNKDKKNVLSILNGIVRCAYAFAYQLDENLIEDKVYSTVLPLVEFIENNDISLN